MKMVVTTDLFVIIKSAIQKQVSCDIHTALEPYTLLFGHKCISKMTEKKHTAITVRTTSNSTPDSESGGQITRVHTHFDGSSTPHAAENDF